MLTLLIGGARSGKSALAVDLGRAQGQPVTFLATARPTDADMEARIERHRLERPEGWRTVEEPLDLASAISTVRPQECLIVDCLSIWTGTAMGDHRIEEIEGIAAHTARLAAARPGTTIAVTNEVGMGVHPSTPLGREYRDVHGRVNTIWARAAHRALLVVAGHLLELAPPHDVIEALR